MANLSLQEAQDLVVKALRLAGAGETMALSTARALVRADAQGLASHGLSRVPQYASHLRNGRADGKAQAAVIKEKAAALLVDARQGLAFPACDLAIAKGIEVAGKLGVCFVGVTNSHHCGVVVDHLRVAAQAGLVGLGFSNSPAAMPAAGGRHPVFGTNPVAAVFPRRGQEPLLIDLSLSEVARGKLMVAAKEGQPIPLGWALDANGQPTTDPKAGMSGSMLALVVELLVTALIGAHFGFEASTFFEDEGNQPRIGQAFILIDPGALAGSGAYFDRLEVLITEMLTDPDVRLPGARRIDLERRAQTAGITIPDPLNNQLRQLAAG